MSDFLDGLLGEFIDIAESTSEVEGLWRETPVDIITFFKDYMGESPYPGKQTELLQNVNDIMWYKLTGDEKFCQEDLQQITEMVILFGKGSGKDFLASGILTYVIYLVLCLNDPHTYFGFGKDENIDFINVAINAYQANNVYFKKLKARLNNCKWFVKVTKEPRAWNEYQVLKNQVRFFKGVTAHSAHSEADSFEGFNPLVLIYDEIGGFEFEKAEFCYATLRSSASSRFNEKQLHIFISFPRSESDFMYSKYKEAIHSKDPEVYAITGYSWEVNPKISRKSLEKDFIRDPEGSRMRYQCIPPKYSEGLFQFPEKIDTVVQRGKHAQCQTLTVQNTITTRVLKNGEERHFTGLEIHGLQLDPNYTYYLGGDGGVETDSYVLALFHGEPTKIEVLEEGEVIEKYANKPVEDLILEWKPNKADRIPVDLMNVAEVIEMICKQVYVKKALFDKFNSAEVVQRLMGMGVEAEDKNWSNPFQLQIYQNIKGHIYTGNIELLDHINLEGMNANEELKNIKLLNGNKIDHDKDKSKDYSDARAGAVWLCATDEPDDSEHFAMPTLLGARRRA